MYPALTDHPTTRTSPAGNNRHMMMLRLASLLPVNSTGPGTNPEESEVTTTEQTWTNHDSGGNTRESMNVLQERPAPKYLGIVNHKRKRSEKQIVLHVQIQPNYATNEQVTLTVMIGSAMLCGVAMHPKSTQNIT